MLKILAAPLFLAAMANSSKTSREAAAGTRGKWFVENSVLKLVYSDNKTNLEYTLKEISDSTLILSWKGIHGQVVETYHVQAK